MKLSTRFALLLGASFALILLGFGAPATAQTTYLGFGDSITEGFGDDPNLTERGYLPRLETLMNNAGMNAVMINRGVGGEDTSEGVSRIGPALAETGVSQGDVLLLMEGTNDINRGISPETSAFNLDIMADRAESLGLQVVHATVIPRPPDARNDPETQTTSTLCGEIRNLAGSLGRDLVDPFQVFGATPGVFNDLYFDGPEDRVGHPNAAGYDRMAEIFFDVLTGVDSVPPVVGFASPADGARRISPQAEIEVDLWDFGAGTDLGASRLLVNGENTGVTPQGNSRRSTWVYRAPGRLANVVTVTMEVQDRANPPNSTTTEVSQFVISGTPFLDGDVDRDGRVDGTDLVQFAVVFGSTMGDGRFDPLRDFNDDSVINGDDLAILAGNFGERSF